MIDRLVFRDLMVGDTFDFINDTRLDNSFFDRCVKTSPRKYKSQVTGLDYTITTIGHYVYHVETVEAKILAELSDIAKRKLFIETLNVRHRDSLDFKEVSIMGLRNALRAAYDLGKNSK